VYCHPSDDWPPDDELDVVERVGVRSCVRRGVAVDLVLERARENRSQFVFTVARGRQMVFWQSARTAKQARPNARVPTAMAAASRFEILVDTRERYAWRFTEQQVDVASRALAVGDYAVAVDGRLVAVVERKSLADLVSTISGGKLWMLLAELDHPDRSAAIVVEDRYSSVFKLRHARPSAIATQIAEAAVRYPTVPIVFAETRQLGQEWTYRFLGAAVDHERNERVGGARIDELVAAGSVPHRAPSPAEVRTWAATTGFSVADRGRISAAVMRAYLDAHRRPR
jgi:hypothetical protein